MCLNKLSKSEHTFMLLLTVYVTFQYGFYVNKYFLMQYYKNHLWYSQILCKNAEKFRIIYESEIAVILNT